MADLLAAAQKQIEYAGNEFASGDTAKGQTHLDKAAAFIQRAAGETAAAPAGDSEAEPTADEPLSSDASTATSQLLARTGHPVSETGATSEHAEVIEDATEEQIRELALLGFFGQPGQHDVDYSLFEQYYEQSPVTGLDEGGQPIGGAWTPKNQAENYIGAWADYLATKGS